MKMSDIRIPALNAFRAKVENDDVRIFFSECFYLWGESESLYRPEEVDKISATVSRFTTQINSEIKRIEMLRLSEITSPTKKTIVTQRGESTETATDRSETTREATNNRQTETGKSGQTAYQYPDGYIGSMDQAYVRSRAEEDERNDIETSANLENGTTERTNDKNNENTSESETITTDDFLLSKLYDYSSKISMLVNKCVFAFVANTTIGGF